MSQQEQLNLPGKVITNHIVEFLRNNLRLGIHVDRERDYESSYHSVDVHLYMTDPETGKEELICSDTFTIYTDEVE